MPEIQAAPPLRADARRNRDALLTAARSVFAELGLDAPLDAIAKRAGVGRATLYRRFPTRDALIAAIFDDDFAALSEVVAQADDPSNAYFDFLEAAMQLQCDNLGFIELFTRAPNNTDVMDQIDRRWVDAITGPLAAAQDAGLVRSDLTPEDTGTMLLMIGAATANLRNAPNGDVRRRRMIELVFDGADPSRAPRHLPEND
ncbi:MAG: helix-turn-helix domain-containing protein [Solirubrobacteraceae bacterium]|nr:helix-turn-helix domain-containing protein [Patulibacter sp.]